MVNIYVLPSFEHLKKVCEPYIFLKDTDAKLKWWSNLGLLRYMIHVAMSPVLHVEGCRTRPGSIAVVHHHTGIHLHGVIMAFQLSLFCLLS
jgi:hypothetical protein